MVVLIDPFTSYLSGIVRKYCNDNDIEIVEGVSEYLCGAIGGVPETLRAPKLATVSCPPPQSRVARNPFHPQVSV